MRNEVVIGVVQKGVFLSNTWLITQIMALRGKVSELEHKLTQQTAEQLHLQRMLLKAQEVIVHLSSQGSSTLAADDPVLREMIAQVLPSANREEFSERHLEQLLQPPQQG